MKNWRKYSYIFRKFLLVALLIDIIYRTAGDTIELIIFPAMFLLININDYIRFNYLYKKAANIYYISNVISILMAGILILFVRGYIQIYLFISVADIAFIRDKKVAKYLHAFNISVLIVSTTIKLAIYENIGVIQVIREDILGFTMFLALIFFNIISIYSYRALIIQKNKVEKLNKEIEELTITKERNRVAQEIHDNLGHSLVALNMNLDVANNMVDMDIDKTKRLINKCQSLTKESTENLRRAVYALKDQDLSQGFIEPVERLINNITDTSNIDIIYNIDNNIENLTIGYKNILYNIIKESITNSIKHGKSSKIKIEVKVEDKVHLSIKDNGIGCEELIKGNGLTGIEERVNMVGGKVQYIINEKGFGIKVLI